MYHVNPETGNPNICRATQGGCPFGASNEHFATKVEARDFYERKMDDATESLKTVQKDIGVSRLAKKLDKLNEERVELENNPGLHQYGFPEDEMIRGRINDLIRERKEEITKVEAEFSGFAPWKESTPALHYSDVYSFADKNGNELGLARESYRWSGSGDRTIIVYDGKGSELTQAGSFPEARAFMERNF